MSRGLDGNVAGDATEVARFGVIEPARVGRRASREIVQFGGGGVDINVAGAEVSWVELSVPRVCR